MPAKTLKGVIAVVVVCAVGVAGWYAFFGGATQTAQRRARPPVPVVVARAAMGPLVERIQAVGTARANESVTITAKVTDVVQAIHFHEGRKVNKGDLLVQLRDLEQRALLSKAEADMVAARQRYQRISKLARRGTATSAQLEDATAKMQVLRAEITAIKARVGDRAIRAPFAGVVGLRRVSPGTLIQPGTAITTLDDLSVIKLDFAVPETYVAVLSQGQEIAARVAAYPARRFTGRITVVSPRVNPATRAVAVRARLPNKDSALKPGMLIVVDVIRSRRRALLVPEEAVIPVRDRTFVYVIDETNRARRIAVRLGVRQPGLVEVVSGLAAGQRVVVEGTTRLRPGARVRVTGTARPSEGG